MKIEKATEGTLNGRPITVMPTSAQEQFTNMLYIVEHDSGDSYHIPANKPGLRIPVVENTFSYLEDVLRGNCYA